MSLDISKLQPAQVEQYIHLQGIVDRQANEAAKIVAYRAYYSGDHPVLLTRRQREYLGDLLNAEQFTFAHNLVKRVVDTIRARLAVSGVTVNGETTTGTEASPNTELAALLWAWWKESRLDSAQIDLYRRALRDGYSYIIVDWDNDDARPRFTLHKRDDGTTGVMLHYDPEDEARTLFATKYFYAFDPLRPGTTGRERKTVYLPGEIRKYIRGNTATATWEPYQEAGDATWPLPWVDSQGKPLGVACIEFPNPGGSEIDAIIGLQNALNKTWLDILAAADTSGFPLIAVEYAGDGGMTGAPDDDNLTGTDEFRISPGRAIEVDNATVHRLEAANLDPMLNVMWTVVQAISGVSDIPQYYLRPVGGDVPSGEALKQLESGLVKRAEERQLIFGQAWEECFELAYRLAQTFGTVQAGDIEIDVQWVDANVRNEQVVAQTAQLHSAMGVPQDTIWQMLGYSPEQIAIWGAAKSAQDAARIAQVAQALQSAGGNNGGTGQAVQQNRNVGNGNNTIGGGRVAGGGVDDNTDDGE